MLVSAKHAKRGYGRKTLGSTITDSIKNTNPTYLRPHTAKGKMPTVKNDLAHVTGSGKYNNKTMVLMPTIADALGIIDQQIMVYLTYPVQP